MLGKNWYLTDEMVDDMQCGTTIKPDQISILLPTCHRPFGLRTALTTIRDTAPECSVVVATDPDDEEARQIAQEFGATVCVTSGKHCGCHVAWNVALAHAPADALAYVCAADDCVFKPGWLEAALKTLDELGGSGLVGLECDKHPGKIRTPPTDWSTHFLMTRDHLIKYNGGVLMFEHYYCDYSLAESCWRAWVVGRYKHSYNAHVTHLWRKQNDETYRKSDPFRITSKVEFERRKALGFPDDFPPVLKG
jgi:glycosyltransferase involved in cell wall biosynthesis